ncbi:MAG: hypothetical protein IT426_04185 [Pirellulales bacterium]|nr:hypothetical protein [Pirellulales bacterium]
MSDDRQHAAKSSSAKNSIRIICPNCGSKLNAKTKLLGESRPCPKCKEPVKIAILENHDLLPSIPLEEPDANLPHLLGNKVQLANTRPIERLDRNFRYLICDRAAIVAAWANDGNGWMLKTHAGMVPAARNPEKLPSQGDFKLVELKLESRAAGLHLLGLSVYQLAPRWALTVLDEGDDRICERVTGRGALGREQKFAVRRTLRENFMPEVWEHARNVLDYLANADYHSSGVG